MAKEESVSLSNLSNDPEDWRKLTLSVALNQLSSFEGMIMQARMDGLDTTASEKMRSELLKAIEKCCPGLTEALKRVSPLMGGDDGRTYVKGPEGKQ